MENYIRVYENVVSNNWCDALVQKFEDFDDCHEVINNKMSFTQINFGRDSLWKYESDYLEKVILEQVERYKEDVKIDNQLIKEILTVNGVRFVLEDGSWGLIRASSNKPSLVVVTESTSSDSGKKKIFNFIDNLLQKTGKIGKYDQKI